MGGLFVNQQQETHGWPDSSCSASLLWTAPKKISISRGPAASEFVFQFFPSPYTEQTKNKVWPCARKFICIIKHTTYVQLMYTHVHIYTHMYAQCVFGDWTFHSFKCTPWIIVWSFSNHIDCILGRAQNTVSVGKVLLYKPYILPTASILIPLKYIFKNFYSDRSKIFILWPFSP